MSSFSGVLQYVRERMQSLGYEEHPDAFNFDNIPSTDFDTMYHCEYLPSVPRTSDHSSIEITCPFRLRLPFHLNRDTGVKRDDVIESADLVVNDFIAAENRLGTGIKNIEFDIMDIETIADSNDNAVRLILEFTAIIVKSTGRTGG